MLKIQVFSYVSSFPIKLEITPSGYINYKLRSSKQVKLKSIVT